MASEDGKNVVFERETTTRVMDLFVVPFEGGTLHRLTSEGRRIGQYVWAQDGKSIIFASDREGVGGRTIWRVSITGGMIEPENSALLAKIHPQQQPRSALSRDRRRMVYVDEHADNSWVLRVHLASPGGRVLSQEKVLQSPEMGEPRFSADGRHIAFSSRLSGADNIWISEADGQSTLQLTSFSGELAGSPDWSPDGKWLVFDRRPGDHAQIFMIDAEGRNMHALTDGEHENIVPNWSRDGRAVYFASNRTGKFELWKHDIATDVSTQITKRGGFSGMESYDGRYLYFVKYFGSGIWRVPIGGGEEEQIIKQPESWYSRYRDAAERGIYFYDVGATPRPAIKLNNFDTRQTTTVLEPEGQAIEWGAGISVSRDGRTLLYSARHSTTTLMVADEIR
jgi:Tol biopolymer transport system component